MEILVVLIAAIIGGIVGYYTVDAIISEIRWNKYKKDLDYINSIRNLENLLKNK